MIVMKFGGTSVADCAAITRTIGIVESKLQQRPIVVVSALSKVTDLLYKISDKAREKDNEGAADLLRQLRERHLNLAAELIPDNAEILADACARVNRLCDNLEYFVNAVCALGELSDRSKAVIIGNGEYLSSSIICCAMNARGIRTRLMDSRKMIITDNNFLKGEPQTEEIVKNVSREVAEAYTQDMDAVITTRELVQWCRECRLRLKASLQCLAEAALTTRLPSSECLWMRRSSRSGPMWTESRRRTRARWRILSASTGYRLRKLPRWPISERRCSIQ